MRATRRLPPRAIAVAGRKNLRTAFGARERPRTSRPRAALIHAQRGAPTAACACNPTRMRSPCRPFSLSSADPQGTALCAREQARKVPWRARSNVARAGPRVGPPQNPKRRRRAAAVGAHIQNCGQTAISPAPSRSEAICAGARKHAHIPRNRLGTHGAPTEHKHKQAGAINRKRAAPQRRSLVLRCPTVPSDGRCASCPMRWAAAAGRLRGVGAEFRQNSLL